MEKSSPGPSAAHGLLLEEASLDNPVCAMRCFAKVMSGRYSDRRPDGEPPLASPIPNLAAASPQSGVARAVIQPYHPEGVAVRFAAHTTPARATASAALSWGIHSSPPGGRTSAMPSSAFLVTGLEGMRISGEFLPPFRWRSDLQFAQSLYT